MSPNYFQNEIMRKGAYLPNQEDLHILISHVELLHDALLHVVASHREH